MNKSIRIEKDKSKKCRDRQYEVSKEEKKESRERKENSETKERKNELTKVKFISIDVRHCV